MKRIVSGFFFREGKYRVPYSLLLLAAALLSFWQFTFFRNGLQWDIQDVMMPWRYFAGENLRNGMLPLWNPYQQFGYPFFADLQYTNWNPEAWLIGTLFGYSYKTFYALIFFYVWMAGLGMFRLAEFFSKDRRIAFFIACCYMLSGCTVAHMQQFVVIMGMAWLPFVAWQFFAFMEELSWKNVFGFSLFSFLLMTTGYQALYFMLIYVFAAVIIYKVYTWWKQADRKRITRFLARGAVLCVLTFILLLPVLIAVMQSAPYVSRLDKGVSISEAQLSPFSPQSAVSFLLPAAAAKGAGWLDTDFSCTNIFFGFIAFFLFLFSLFRRQTPLQLVLLFFTALFLLASFGEYTPVRKLLYDYAPLMNLFRIPGLFRIAALLLMLVQLSIFLGEERSPAAKLKRVFVIACALFIATAVVSYIMIRKEEWAFEKQEDIFAAVHSAPLWEMIFYQSVFFAALSVTGFFTVKKKNGEVNWKGTTLVSLLSLFAGIQFNIYINIAADTRPAYPAAWMKGLPEGFPLPALCAQEDYMAQTDRGSYFVSNSGNFLKKHFSNDFSSFQFKQLGVVSDELPQLRKQFLLYPIAYLSDSILHGAEWKQLNASAAPSRRITFLEGRELAGEKFRVSPSDNIICRKFYPQHFSFEVTNSRPVIFNLLQSYFPGWKISVDGTEQPVLLNAGLCMSVPLEAGKHSIELRFGADAFVSSLIVALSLFFILLSVFIFLSLSDNARFIFGSVPLLLYGLSWLLFMGAKERAEQHEQRAAAFARHLLPYRSSALFSTHHVPANDPVVFSDNPADFASALRKISNCRSSRFIYAWYGEQPDSRLTAYIRAFFPEIKKQLSADKNRSGFIVFSREGKTYRDEFEKVFEWGHPSDTLFFEDFLVDSIAGESAEEPVAILQKRGSYGPAFVADPLKLGGGKKSGLRISFYMKAGEGDSLLLFATLRDRAGGKQRWERVYALQPYVLEHNNWNRVCIEVIPDVDFREGEQVKLVPMKLSGNAIRLRDLRVESFAEKPGK